MSDNETIRIKVSSGKIQKITTKNEGDLINKTDKVNGINKEVDNSEESIDEQSKNIPDMSKRESKRKKQPYKKGAVASLVSDHFTRKYQRVSGEPTTPGDIVELSIPADVDDMLNKIKNSVHSHIDSTMLYNMFKLVFLIALNKSEILDLRINDVIEKNGQVKNEIQIEGNKIALSENAKQLVIDHLKYIGSHANYKVQNDAFLFQDKKGKKYGESARQLRDALKIFKPFQTLREAALISYYNALNENIPEKQRYNDAATFARVDDRQANAIITGNKILAGKKTSFSKKLDETWKYTKDINKINETFKDYIKDLENQGKEFIKSINENKKIPDESKIVILKEVDKVFNKNKIRVKDESITISSHKNLSYSNTIKKLTPKDKKFETFEKLLWLIDHANIFPTSDIDEVDRYKDLFLKTLSTLSYPRDSQENQNLKKSLMNLFTDTFFERNVVFNNQIGSPYIWVKKKEDKEKKIILTGLIKDSFKEDVAGKIDQSLLSILEDSRNEDLKHLVEYIIKNSKNNTSSLEIASIYFDDYLNDLENTAEYIQKFQRDEMNVGIKKLAPYKEVVCFVADNLEVNYDQSEETDIVEFNILKKILEYSWGDMDDEIKKRSLIGIFSKEITGADLSFFPKEEMMSLIGHGGEEFYKISLIIANALVMSELNERLIINRESTFVQWVQLFEDVIGESFKKISNDSLIKEKNFFESLTYVVHIAVLRQLQKRRTILFRNFKQFRIPKLA